VAEVDEAASVGQVVQAAIAASVARLGQHQPGVLSGEDPEDVHQARVATRRLRSDLRTFRGVVAREWSDPIREELRWIAGELGAVRDADVLAERLRRQAAALPEGDARSAAALLRRLSDQRDAARAALLTSLAGERYAALVEVLAEGSERPRFVAGAEEKAVVVLPEIVGRPWSHLRRTVHHLRKHPSDGDLHEVRIRAKRARYAAEAAAPVVGKPARRFASAVAGVQAVLGDLHDAAVAEEWLRQTVATARGGPALAAGQLVAAQRTEMADARKAWERAWHKASRKKLRDWLD
jgi:CHAD domain-containing protein